MPTYAVFEDLSQLALGLHLWLDKNAQFSFDVVRTASGQWAIEIAARGLGTAEAVKRHFEELCRYCAITVATDGPAPSDMGSGNTRWSVGLQRERHPSRGTAGVKSPTQVVVVTTGSPPQGETLPLRSIVSAMCVYRDPQFWSPRPPNQAVSGGMSPFSPDICYILAARDAKGAQQLLTGLTNALVTGIRAFMWPLEPASGFTGFRYFWLVESPDPESEQSQAGRVSPIPESVLQQAARAWWGPLIVDPSEVYIEWPWSLDLAPAFLKRINWGDNGSVVLLSQSDTAYQDSITETSEREPDVLVMKRPDRSLDFTSLIDVANLQARERSAVVAEETAVTPDQEFEVELKLVERSRRSQQADRVSDLRIDIRARQLLLARIQDQSLRPGDVDDFVPEPLYLYQGRPARGIRQGAMLPDPLQRLIVEWTDQPGDLGQLQYQCLPAGALPEDMVSPDEQIHVLTTSEAIGKAKASDAEMVNLRLRDYRPTEGGVVAFDLLPEWAEYRLYVFVPQGQWLSLYPEMTPNESTAQKLAGALMPSGEERSRWCVLLTRSPGGRIQVCRLRIEKFCQLVESFEWTCSLDVAVPDTWQEDINRSAPQVDEYFANSVERSFTTVAQAKAEERLKVHRQELKDELDLRSKKLQEEFDRENDRLTKEHEKRMIALKQQAEGLKRQAQQRHKKLDEIEEHLREVDQEACALKGMIDKFASFRAEIQRDIKELSVDQAKVQSYLKDLAKQLRRATETQQRVKKLRGRLERARDSIKRLGR
jgi:hypothetical protein